MAVWPPKTGDFGTAWGFGGQIDASAQHPHRPNGGLVVAGVALLHHVICHDSATVCQYVMTKYASLLSIR